MQPDPGQKNDDFIAAKVSRIYERLEERAIAESNELNRSVLRCRLCPRGDFIPTVGSGHPLADIVLVMYSPRYEEATEGVAFFGRSGTAILKSVEKLGIDPLLVYGTNIVKCPGVASDEGEANCPRYFLWELQITQPKLLVVMGERALQVLNRNLIAGRRALEWKPGEIQEFSHFCSALVTPDIDDALNDRRAKVAFWRAFRTAGDWFRDEPPY